VYAPEGPALVGGRVVTAGDEAAVGSPVGAYRVFRGGSWSFDPGYARVAGRFWGVAGFRYDGGLGFRLARTYP
jgi:formylglycine-generating enzyme required for sulfatase activity